MRNFLKHITIIVFFIPFFLLAQDTIVTQKNYRQLTVDELNNVYVWNATDLKMYSNTSGQTFFYNNISLGSISLVDASYPMKILVYYADFNTIISLDNTLTENGSAIDLANYNLENTSLICRSYNNGIWCYDPVQFKLVRFNEAMHTTNEIENLQNIITTTDSIFFMIETNGLLYLQSPSEIMVFDKFGSYIKTIAIKSDKKISVYEKGIFYLQAGELFFYDFKSLEFNKIKSLDTNNHSILDFSVRNKKLYLLLNKKIITFNL